MPSKDNGTGSYVGNVVEIKISAFELIESKLKDINNHYEDLKTKLSGFVNMSRGNASEFVSNSNVNQIAKYPNKDDVRFHDAEGNLLQWVYERAKDVAYKTAYDYVVEEKNNYLQHLADISSISDKNIQASFESLGEFYNSISKIRAAIENLEAVKCNFQERVEAFRKHFEGLGTSSFERKPSVALSEEREIVTSSYARDTLTEEFVTSEGTKSTFASKYVDEDFELTQKLVEAKALQPVTDTGSTVAESANVSVFGNDSNINWDEANLEKFKDFAVEGWDPKDLGGKAYYAKAEAVSDDLVEYFPNLASSEHSKVGISMDKSLIEKISNSNKIVTDEVKALDAGEVKGETYSPSESNTSSAVLTDTNAASDKTVEVENVNVPKEIPQDSVNNIDEQAKEIYYGKQPQLVSAERANALKAVDSAFNGDNDAEFRNVLSQCYDDVDIDVIMKNKELAVTAFILATESKSLTDIANKLASSQGIENYEPAYENRYSIASLENGVSQSQLLSEVSDDVNNARMEIQSIRARYNDIVKRTNDSIAIANQKKDEMDEVRNRIITTSGEDSSKWSDADIEAYNNAVGQYNDANRAANAIHKEAMDVKAELDQAESKLHVTQQNVANSYLEPAVVASETANNANINMGISQPEQQFNALEPNGSFVDAPSDNKKVTSNDLLNLFNNDSNQTKEKPITALDLSAITPDERTISDEALRSAVFGENKSNNAASE